MHESGGAQRVRPRRDPVIDASSGRRIADPDHERRDTVALVVVEAFVEIGAQIGVAAPEERRTEALIDRGAERIGIGDNAQYSPCRRNDVDGLDDVEYLSTVAAGPENDQRGWAGFAHRYSTLGPAGTRWRASNT